MKLSWQSFESGTGRSPWVMPRGEKGEGAARAVEGGFPGGVGLTEGAASVFANVDVSRFATVCAATLIEGFSAVWRFRRTAFQ